MIHPSSASAVAPEPPRRAVVLLAHGSRDPSWPLPIQAVAQRMRALRPDVPVACAFLESTGPDMATALQELVGTGARHITVVPMFLGLGVHTRQDLPQRVEAAARDHPGIVFHIQAAISEDPAVAELIARTALAEPGQWHATTDPK